MAYTLFGPKWDGTQYGAPATVTWSFADLDLEAVLARQFPGYAALDRPIPSPLRDAVRAAFATWERVAAIDFVEVPDSPASDIRIGEQAADTDNSSFAQYFTNSVAGGGSVITKAVISMDDVTYADARVFQTVVTHEIGHAIGLDHTDDPGDVMYPVIGPANASGALSEGDRAGVTILYGAGAGTQASAGDDDLRGTEQGDVLAGGDGNDRLDGRGGPDDLRGEAGSDRLLGGNGDDTLRGGAGGDVLFGETGNDQIFGEAGSDFIGAGSGDDFASGGDEADEIYGEAGRDLIFGDEGHDRLNGGAEADALYGGTGNDVLFGEVGNDVLSGEAGSDFIGAGGGNDTLNGGADGDALYGEGGDDRLFGDDGADLLDGGLDNDSLSGGLGADTASGGGGTDLLSGEDGDDRLLGGDGADTLSGGEGGDVLFGETGDDLLHGEGGNDFIGAGSGNDAVLGGAGNDALYGEEGNDLLFGHSGDDGLTGGAGDDTYALGRGDGRDLIVGFGRSAGNADVIAFNGGLFGSFAAVQGAMQQVGADTRITIDAATSVTLVGVTAASLDAGAFRFA